MSALLSVQQLSWQADNKQILNNISFDLNEGEVVGIIGPNGAGKTSLLNCLLNQNPDYSGNVFVNGQNTNNLTPKALAHYFSLVAQQVDNVFELSVFDMVRMGLLPHKNLFERDTDSDKRNIEHAINTVGLSHARQDVFSHLSGGEQQRALIARALVQHSNIIILDEPTNHLDVYYQHQILGLIKSLNMTALMTVHDLNLAAQYCDRLILLDHGQIRCDGDINTVLNPQLLTDVFGLNCIKTPHPISDLPHIIFYPENQVNSSCSNQECSNQQCSGVQPEADNENSQQQEHQND